MISDDSAFYSRFTWTYCSLSKSKLLGLKFQIDQEHRGTFVHDHITVGNAEFQFPEVNVYVNGIQGTIPC